MTVNDSRYLHKLGLAIDRHFTSAELVVLAEDLGVDPEKTAGDKKSSMADNIVQQIVRERRLLELRDLVVELKPLVSWPSPEVFASNIDYMEDLPVAQPDQERSGFRFIDIATGAQVWHGLDIRRRQENVRDEGELAILYAAGIYAWPADPENEPDENNGEWAFDPASTNSYWIAIRDEYERFLPISLNLTLPQAAGPKDIYLFSSAERPSLPGQAIVGAQLETVVQRLPAASAVVQVRCQDRTWVGVADDLGRVALQFPYLPLKDLPSTDTDEEMRPLEYQTWPLTVSVLYAPHLQRLMPGSRLPELSSLLKQTLGAIYGSEFETPVTYRNGILRYDEICVLRSGKESVLLVEAEATINR
jgi:hypothetical protein